MTEMDLLDGANADAGALVILGVQSDDTDTDNEDRVAVSSSGYHQLTGGGTSWRDADVVVDDDGSTVFRAAGLLDDGTLVGHAESRGPGAFTASLRIQPDGRWSSVVESGPSAPKPSAACTSPTSQSSCGALVLVAARSCGPRTPGHDSTWSTLAELGLCG